MKKKIIVIYLCMNLMACATTPAPSLDKITFTPENFSNNSRIVFRDMTVSADPTKKIIKKTCISPSIKDQYGASINDSFNHVSHVTRTNFSSPLENEKPLLHTEPSAQKTSQIKFSEGTTYVPLTFPVPPPKDMMQKFHMQVGQISS